jgi:site-specific DNA-cytosine methylase
MTNKKITMINFVPLIGAYTWAKDKLNKEQGYNIELKGSYSFEAFFNPNEQNYNYNHEDKIIHLPDDLVFSFKDGGDKWKSIEPYKKYIKENNIKPVNVQTSVVPCAGLSLLNNANRGADQESTKWMFETVKWYLAQDNDVLVFENAPGLVGKEGLKVLNRVQEVLNYNNANDRKVQIVKTTTLMHGIPQMRNRTFLYIYKNNKHKIVKNIKHEKVDLIPYLEQFNFPKDYDKDGMHVCPTNSMLFLEMVREKGILDEIKEKYKNKSFSTVPTWPTILEHYKKDPNFFGEKYKKFKRAADYKLDKLARGLGFFDTSSLYVKTHTTAMITKNSQRTIHPIYDHRYLSVAEMGMMMGYPRDFKLIEPKKHLNVLCQSVPVKTAADSLKWAIALGGFDNDLIKKEIELNQDDIFLQINTKADLENELATIDWDGKKYLPYKKFTRKTKLILDI